MSTKAVFYSNFQPKMHIFTYIKCNWAFVLFLLLYTKFNELMSIIRLSYIYQACSLLIKKKKHFMDTKLFRSVLVCVII